MAASTVLPRFETCIFAYHAWQDRSAPRISRGGSCVVSSIAMTYKEAECVCASGAGSLVVVNIQTGRLSPNQGLGHSSLSSQVSRSYFLCPKLLTLQNAGPLPFKCKLYFVPTEAPHEPSGARGGGNRHARLTCWLQ